MYSPRSLTNSRTFVKLTALFMLLAALTVSVIPTQAAPGKPASSGVPHGTVSSDGTIPAQNDAGIHRGKNETYVLPEAGNGATAVGAAATATDAPVAPAAVPGQEVGIESVIGTDSRYQIFGTTSYPYSAIVHITSSIGGCTGWLIGPNTVATAGHCVYGNSGWATNVTVYPGRNGSSTPYGSCGYSTLYTVNGWVNSRSPEYDYGAIKLNCTVGYSTGWFGFRWQSASLTGQASYISGYPGDKPYGTQWRSNDSIRITESRRLYYANDTYGGHSGSPVWNDGASCSPCGIAIHAYGVGGNGYNGGTRITEAVFNNLLNWKNS
ncbi:MAG TPA: serine protease [Herpetosiphonaceae bacterium]